MSWERFLEDLAGAWEALSIQNIHHDFQSIPFLKMLGINFSKGLALQSQILGLTCQINRFERPLTLKENREEKEGGGRRTRRRVIN